MFDDSIGLTSTVLLGIKTMTRRDEIDYNLRFYSQMEDTVMKIEDNAIVVYSKDNELLCRKKTRYGVGDVVAVAQPYKDVLDFLPYPHRDSNGRINPEIPASAGYNNKMFVKAELMPIHIKITDIRLESLQDISEGDCLKEGILMSPFETVKETFRSIVNKTMGKETWNYNPVVVVYEFEILKEDLDIALRIAFDSSK